MSNKYVADYNGNNKFTSDLCFVSTIEIQPEGESRSSIIEIGLFDRS